MEDITQVIGIESQETSINIIYIDKKISVYTTRATVMKRMLKKGYKPIKTETMQGDICSMTFEFKTKEVSKILRGDIFKFD